MAFTAADVPGKIDCLINGQGYVFLDSVEPSLPFRTHRAAYSYSQTFIDRQNVQGNYGDDQQAFWMTASQNDWSLGEQQRFFRTDADRSRKFWRGTNVELRVPGQVSIRKTITGLTFAAAIVSCVGGNSQHQAVSATNLYTVDNAGTILDKGAHGLGAAPSQYGMAWDGTYFYFTTTTAGTVGVRRWTGATFGTFSATASDALAFLNNTLYGLTRAGVLQRYDSAGAATTLFTWQTAIGTAQALGPWAKILPFGGKLVILTTISNIGELWIYDGTGVSRLWGMPKNFAPTDMAIANGTIFIGGLATFKENAQSQAVFYWANGSTGLLWAADQTGGTSGPALTDWDNGIIFTDDSRGAFYYYDEGSGSISTLGTYTPNVAGQVLAASTSQFLHSRGATAASYYPALGAAQATSATVTSSLFDLDSSLDKLFRGIKVDFDSATDGNGGNGGTVDIAYRVGDVDAGYTTLQSGAVSGTEYLLSGVSGRNISVKITLNKGTSTAGPVLKRVYVRAAPLLQQFRRREFILDLTNTAKQARKLRDGTYHPKTGREQANDLVTAAQLTTPFSITDKFGTFTGLIDLNSTPGFELYEIHPSPDEPVKSGAFVARVLVREI